MGNGKWEGSGVGRRGGLYDIFLRRGMDLGLSRAVTH